MKRKKLKLIIGLGIILVSMCIFCYSTVSSTWNEYVASKLVTEYSERVDGLSEEDYTLEVKKAVTYNETVVRGTGLVSGTQFEKDDTYEDTLNLLGDGMMGYIEIPDISQKLPIYHYTDDEQLASGIGHLHGSSLPIGTEGNCILTGHTGLAENLLFTRLDELEVGDEFYIHVLDLDLAYRITDIYTVLPEEVEGLKIEEGRDLVTLITCTPYGVNSHRLIVIGERCDYPTERTEITAKEVVSKAVSKWRLYVCAGLFVIITIVVVRKYGKKKNHATVIHSDRSYHDDNSGSD